MKKLGMVVLVGKTSTDLYGELVLKLMNQVFQSLSVSLYLLKADVHLQTCTGTQFIIGRFNIEKHKHRPTKHSYLHKLPGMNVYIFV